MNKVRKNRFIFFLLLSCSLGLGYFICGTQLNTDRGVGHGGIPPNVWDYGWLYYEPYEPGLILDAPLCKIPRTPIFPDYYKRNWRLDKVPDCTYEQTLGKLSPDGTSFRLYPEYQNTGCSAAEIKRAENDHSYRRMEWKEAKVEVDLEEWEFFVVRCGGALNFDSSLRVSPEVKLKSEFWKQPPSKATPISVMLLGFDSVSRSHAHRSLPRTMGLMKKMGFHDFQGYHSLAPSTLTNFMGFLIGLRRDIIRETCAPDWTTPFDACPFIWKNYSHNNYVTMYIEDGEQTFNWGGQSGFRQQPTDYYVHPLFSAIEGMRSWNMNTMTQAQRNLHAYCTSSETSPEFVTRYTHRFLEKFKEIPFFSFTFYAYPFHDNAYTVQTLDEQLWALYHHINATSRLRENTLLVFLSDHGERQGSFVAEEMEGFIERGLPPLYIRIPETLVRLYPEMNLHPAMEANTHALVSAFDLHHTLLHLLSLSGFESESPDFQPAGGADRRSLFLSPGNQSRTCKALHINPDSCVCNTALKANTFLNSHFLNKIAEFLAGALNTMVKERGFQELCEKWTVSPDGIASSLILGQANTTTEVLIRFKADPKDALFEGKVLVTHKETEFDSAELVGELNRLSLYGRQSACIPFRTDSDKKMKELCYCKS